MKLEGRVAVITGGNSGIGRAAPELFTAEGANVVVSGRNQDTLDETVGAIGNGTLAVRADVSKLADIDSLFEQAVSRFGKIDVLVANAGDGRAAPLDQVTEGSFDEISDTNFKGTYFTVQKGAPHLNEGASVILVTSASHHKGMAGSTVYSATKAAVRALARSFSAELLPRGVRVNALCPGFTETPFYGRLGLPQEAIGGMAASMLENRIPIGRFASAGEIANVALFLASSDSSYLAGEEINADGGLAQL